MHSDLCESNVTSIGGGKHILTFTDDHTNHGVIYILPNKNSSTVLNAFKEYQAWAERQSGHKIKELRTDRGTEYMGDMIKYVKSKGIEHNPTAGYSPQSNGVAEHMNRTLIDMTCTMLDASGAPLELWAEAILAACHIRNRLPSRTLDGKSPHEAWTGQKPKVGHIRKWGCKAYRLINKKAGRKKFQKGFKSMEGYLVGYELPGGVNYRLYHPGTKEFKVSRDVIFDEKEYFNVRNVAENSEGIHSTADRHGTEFGLEILGNDGAEEDTGANQEVENESGETEQEKDLENAAPIIYDEIVVQLPPSEPPPLVPPPSESPPPPKPLTRRSKRMIARAFKAVVKGNWNLPRNYYEAMETEEAEEWKKASQKEYDPFSRTTLGL